MIRVQRRKGESGQALFIVVAAMSLVLFGALGFAIDGAQLFAQRQMAQVAADAAAQAGITSIFNGTNGAGTHAFSTGSSFTCGTNDAKTPCYYAQTLNKFGTSVDTVAVSFPTSVPNVSSGILSSDPVNLITVTVQRTLNTTLMRFLGSSTSTVKATATAAILSALAPVPILVTHPTMSGSFNLGGSGSGAKITICGGPARSIQVNSTSGTSMTWNGNPVVNLAHAGPADPGNCTTGTGADFGNTGGPTSGGSIVSFGTTGNYDDKAFVIQDPLAGVNPPSDPGGSQPATSTINNGTHGCPAGTTCTVFSPGKYTGDIDVKGMTALFEPGIYYLYGANFKVESNGIPLMATGYTDATTSWTGNMLVYLTGPSGANGDNTGSISVSANAGGTGSILMGSPNSSSYEGILFFVDRNAAAQTHSIDGGATIGLTGTIYTTNSLSVMQAHPTQFQTLHFQGNGSGSTLITGEIITSALDLQGTPGILMDLNSLPSYTVRQIALVN